MHELVEDLVHNRALGAGEVFSDNLMPGGRVEDMAVIDVGFVSMHVVVP